MLTWESPDGGEWWFEAAHFPKPVSRLWWDVLDTVCQGWVTGARAWGRAHGGARWAHVNGYLYYGARGERAEADAALAERAVSERWWVEEARRWFDEERPAAVRINEGLQAVDVSRIDDDVLVGHIRAIVEHVRRVGPLHFSHRGREAVREQLDRRAEAEGVDRALLAAAFAGGSPATRRPAELVAAIAGALRAGGIDPSSVRSLDDVRKVPDAGAALDAYLREFGHRLIDYDLAQPALHERPAIVVASIRAAAEARAPGRPELPAVSDELRRLVDEARVSYGIEDDDDGVCLFWPLGLLRRALLELARRRGFADVDAVFEVDLGELDALLSGMGPDEDVLLDRLAARRRAASVAPPAALGAPSADDSPAPDRDGTLRGEGVGDGRVRGRACVVRSDDDDGLLRLEPGDVLITVTTTPGYNAVLPIVAAVATETRMGHTVICARELAIPAVIGVPGLVDAVPDGALVEVDAAAGTVTVVG